MGLWVMHLKNLRVMPSGKCSMVILPMGFQPDQLGKYSECYAEMARAYGQGGTEAARLVFVAYADHDYEIAALRANDPET